MGFFIFRVIYISSYEKNKGGNYNDGLIKTKNIYKIYERNHC